MPVYAVPKEIYKTTKLRAVFDTSAKTNCLRLRPCYFTSHQSSTVFVHTIALTSDVAKMYCEIALYPTEYNFHRYLVKGNDDKIQDMSYLWCVSVPIPLLKQLAKDYINDCPDASRVSTTDFTGTSDVPTAISLQKELYIFFNQGLMSLHKWKTNHPYLINPIPEHFQETNTSSENP